jgi:hypothetical protein
MRQSGNLACLRDCACKRALRLRALVERCKPPLNPIEARTVAFVSIEVVNLWATFVRAFYLSCMHKAKRAGGGHVTVAVPGLNTDDAAIAFSLKVIKIHRRGEPVWHEPATLSKLFVAVRASNLTQVLAAISAQPQVFQLLPTIRNFFAHRSLQTSQKVVGVARTIGVNVRLRPCDILCSRLPARPQNVLADWIDDIRNTIDLACQ